ncbi:hypothetical protein, partial [Actinoplanes utahensis]|uniref:hypothetical protein n=1 Tax=Actinoplanes utahensis TaxID=1869 RepID=UPI0031ED12C9
FIPGLDVSDLGMKLVQTGGIGAFILVAGRMLRRANGLTAYLWLTGTVLTIIGLLVASGILNIDAGRVTEIYEFVAMTWDQVKEPTWRVRLHRLLFIYT